MSDQIKQDSEKFYNALKKLVRIYQFRDRDNIPDCCNGLSINQYYVIESIITNDSIGVIDLTKILFLNKSTISRIVDQLVTKGYLIKKISQNDGRAIELEVTPKSIAAYRQITTNEINGINNLFDEMDTQSRSESINLMQSIADDAEREFSL